MAAKKSKVIKQQQKKIKKLNARIDELKEEIRRLQEAWPEQHFSESQVEVAEENSEDAGEIDDIIDKANWKP